MRHFLLFLSGLLVLLFAGCSLVRTYKVSFTKTGQKEITPPYTAGLVNRFYYDFEGRKPFIAVHSEVYNKIYCHDYESGKLIQTIDIGITGCTWLRTFQFRDPNTIAFSEVGSTKIYVIDTLSVVRNTFDFKEYDPNVSGITYGNFNKSYSNIQFVGDCMVIYNAMITSDSALNRLNENFIVSDYDGSNPFMRGRCNIRYRTNVALSDYEKVAGKFAYEPRTFLMRDTLYFGLYSNDTIHIYDCNGYIGKTITKRSSYVEDWYANPNEIPDPFYCAMANVRKSGNEAIYYDKYRNLIYKVVAHPNKYFMFENPNFSWTGVKEFSIMIFDDKFNFIDEIAFPAKTYWYPSNLIITSKEVLIDKANRYNPEYKGYKMQWDVFNVKVKKR